MLSSVSPIAMMSFLLFVTILLGASFYRRGRGAPANASDRAPWFVHGVAFAGDYLAIAFLGVCGMIAYDGYDGVVYCVGSLAGLVVALLLMAGPSRHMGTFALAGPSAGGLDSPGARRVGAISSVIISICYLLPQMVGAGALLKPLMNGHAAVSVVIAGVVAVEMVLVGRGASSAWGRFFKCSLLVVFCAILTPAVLSRGFTAKAEDQFPRLMDNRTFADKIAPAGKVLYPTGAWAKLAFVRVASPDGSISTWHVEGQSSRPVTLWWPSTFVECQTLTTTSDGKTLVNGLPQKEGNDLQSAGFVATLPGEKAQTGALRPLSFLTTFLHSDIGLPKSERIADADGSVTMVYYPKITPGGDIMTAGNDAMLFPGIRVHATWDVLNFISFMAALFFGTVVLAPLFARPFVGSDEDSGRRSGATAVAIIGVFYILMLFLGLGALAQGTLHPDFALSNSAGPLLARSFGDVAWALILALVFTIVLGTASRVVAGVSRVVAEDVLASFVKHDADERAKARAGKVTAVCVGAVAIPLAIACQKFNVALLVAWAFNVAASANLPALTMPRLWKGTTARGVGASILVGLISSITWIMLSADAYVNIYGLKATDAPMKVDQPALFTIPLSFLTLIVVSLITAKRDEKPTSPGANAAQG